MSGGDRPAQDGELLLVQRAQQCVVVGNAAPREADVVGGRFHRPKLGLAEHPDRPAAFRAAAVLVPLLLWGAWMAVYALAYRIAWPPELWAGVLGMACLSGLGLSVLVLPPAVPDGTWDVPSA